MSSIMHIDLETENHEYYGSKASPYCPDNYVVESAWRIDRAQADGSTDVGPVEFVRYSNREDFIAAGSAWLPIPDDCWLIVAHNAAYEISWFLTYARDAFEAFLKRGGRIWCTMHGEYLVTDQQSMYASLDETAPLYGGTHKVDGVKILWEQGVLTSQIDPMLLHDYLVNGDIPNTALVFYGQYAKFTERGQFPLVWERMDAMLAFAYCEWFGLWVNMPVAKANQAEQEKRITELKTELNDLLPPDLPETFKFNWGSNYHMSALIYGGPIKYKKRVSYDPIKFEKEDYFIFRNARGDETRVRCTDTQMCAGMYEAGWTIDTYRAGKNKGQPKVHRLDTDVEKLKWEEDLFYFPGHIKIDNLPGHIAEKYGDRGEFRGAQLLPDGSPVFSTSGDAMSGLAAQGFKAAKLVNELASLEKDTGTYYLRTEYAKDGSVKKLSGMLQYVIPMDDDGSGIIHHRLNTCATVTTRLSSGNPNLQNLPRDGTSKVKQMFTSRFGSNGRIIEVDYSALEVVMGCVHTGDLKLLHLLQTDTDMHCYRLAFKEGMDYAEVKRLAVDEEDGPDYKVWKGKRTKIKTPSFAAQYGATAKGIAFATGESVEFCQEFLDNEAKMFPDSIKFRDVIRREVERTGALPGQLKREQNDDGSWSVYKVGYWTSPSGQRYAFRQKKQWKDGRQVMDYKATEMANYWCQGEAFFMMAVAFGMLIRHLIANDFYGGKVALMTNVHDAAYLDAAEEVVGRQAALDTKHIMETARDRILSFWPDYGILKDVPFPAAAEMGESMYSKTHVH